MTIAQPPLKAEKSHWTLLALTVPPFTHFQPIYRYFTGRREHWKRHWRRHWQNRAIQVRRHKFFLSSLLTSCNALKTDSLCCAYRLALLKSGGPAKEIQTTLPTSHEANQLMPAFPSDLPMLSKATSDFVRCIFCNHSLLHTCGPPTNAACAQYVYTWILTFLLLASGNIIGMNCSNEDETMCG